MQTIDERLQQALNTETPFESLYALAQAFKEEGMEQDDMYILFDKWRAEYEALQAGDKVDIVMDVMDHIVGFCPVGKRLFDTW